MDKRTRADKAGEAMAKSIVEMINLMYQNNTAFNFLNSLLTHLHKDFMRRMEERKNKAGS